MIRKLSRHMPTIGRLDRASFWKFAVFWLPLGTFILWLMAPHIRLKPEIISAMCLFLIVTIPFWFAAARRLHDSGRSAQIILVVLLVPSAHLAFAQLYFTGMISSENRFFGFIFLVYYFAGFFLLITAHLCAILIALFQCTKPSQSGSNAYGPNPNEVTQ